MTPDINNLLQSSKGKSQIAIDQNGESLYKDTK